MNLLKETQNILSTNEKTFDDLIVAAGKDFKFPISEFIKLANIEYDDGYGWSEVATDLVLIGRDFWLERNDYDGAEWWEFKTPPKYEHLPILYPNSLTVGQAKVDCGDYTLHDLNKELFPESEEESNG